MKFFLLIIPFIFTHSLSAYEISSDEFPLIKPVSVEKAKIEEKTTPKAAEAVAEIQDGDNDGVEDKDDKCPDTPEGITVNSDGCEADQDEDGVADSIDECPETGKDFIVNKVGCPQTAMLKINFDVDKYDINSQSLSKVEEFAYFLQENPDYNAVVYGHTDITGSDEHNDELSVNRAKAVMNALVDLGIDKIRLTAIGMGSKNPVADNDTPEGLAQNRRIEVELIK